MIHPLSVHFAIVLPIIVLIFQVLSLVKKDRNLSKITLILMFATAFSVVIAWLTGGKEAIDVYPLLTEEAQALLKQHKDLGMMLGIGFAILTVLKLLAYKRECKVMETVFTVLLLLAISQNMLQGKMGGELVYQNGAGVECPEEYDDE